MVESKSTKPERDIELEWWLVQMGIEDRAFYRELRELAWEFVVGNHQRSTRPNN